jgi:hypothetical protein
MHMRMHMHMHMHVHMPMHMHMHMQMHDAHDTPLGRLVWRHPRSIIYRGSSQCVALNMNARSSPIRFASVAIALDTLLEIGSRVRGWVRGRSSGQGQGQGGWVGVVLRSGLGSASRLGLGIGSGCRVRRVESRVRIWGEDSCDSQGGDGWDFET